MLVERLSSQYPGQIVQILTNLEHFEIACQELQVLLFEARSSSSAAGPIVLKATEQFRAGKKTAEKRIFELVNSKIDDLIETAEYDWYATHQLGTCERAGLIRVIGNRRSRHWKSATTCKS